MIGQLGGRHFLGVQRCQGALVQDLPTRLAEIGVDYISDQVMGEAIAAQPACPCVLLAQEPASDSLLQGR